MLTEASMDVFTEMVNIGAGRAVAALATLISASVGRQLPQVWSPCGCGGSASETAATSVSLAFSGPLHGRGSLELSSESARRLTSALTGACPDPLRQLDEEQEAVLTEIGNIVVNNIIGSIGNLIALDLAYSPPELTNATHDRDPGSVCARAGFRVDWLGVEGYLVVVVDTNAAVVERLLAEVRGTEPTPGPT